MKVLTPERALSRRRLMLRAAVGLLTRGSQGLFLAVAVRVTTAQDAAELAILLAVCTAVNLISNVGIPTLIIRSWRQGWDMPERFALLRGYAWLSLAGCMFSSLLILLLGGGWWIAALGGLLCFFQSAYYGAEYWSLARGNVAYDSFLRTSGLLQALLCLLAPAMTWAFKSTLVGILFLCSSFFVSCVSIILGSNVRSIRTLFQVFGRPYLRGRWSDAVGVGMATMAMAIVYNADAVVLRLSFNDGSLASYRLALLCVSFLVALLPINIFLLADVSTGNITPYARIATLGLLYVAASVAFALLLSAIGSQFEQASASLLLLSPIAFIRLLCQALVSELNALGLHRFVFASFGIGIIFWLGVALCTSLFSVTLGDLALVQTAIELTILVLLLVALRWIRSRSAHPPVPAGEAEAGC